MHLLYTIVFGEYYPVNRIDRPAWRHGWCGSLRLEGLSYLRADLPSLVLLDRSCLKIDSFLGCAFGPGWQGLSAPGASETAAERPILCHLSRAPVKTLLVTTCLSCYLRPTSVANAACGKTPCLTAATTNSAMASIYATGSRVLTTFSQRRSDCDQAALHRVGGRYRL